MVGLPVAQPNYITSFLRQKNTKLRIDHSEGIACPNPSPLPHVRAAHLTFLGKVMSHFQRENI